MWTQVRLIWLVAVKDLRVEYRSRQAFLTTLFFAVLILAIFVFAFDPGSRSTREAAPGILWVALLFPGVIQLNRSFQLETEEGSLQGIVLSPLDRGVYYLGKLLANWIFLILLDTLILVAFVIFFNFEFSSSLIWIGLIMLLASIGFTAVGTFFAAMVCRIQTREALLPVLLFPMLVSIILAAVNGTQEVLIREEIENLNRWLQILAVADVVFVASGFALFDYVLAE